MCTSVHWLDWKLIIFTEKNRQEQTLERFSSFSISKHCSATWSNQERGSGKSNFIFWIFSFSSLKFPLYGKHFQAKLGENMENLMFQDLYIFRFICVICDFEDEILSCLLSLNISSSIVVTVLRVCAVLPLEHTF